MGRSIKNLLRYLDNIAERMEITEFSIKESEYKQSYIVHNLEAEVENDMIMFSDAEGIIEDNEVSIVKMISLGLINDIVILGNEINIIMKTGNINIKVVG
jgi:hypothetical protein